MKVLGICGSLRRGSFNRLALAAACELAPVGMAIEVFETLKEVPLFDADDFAGGFPLSVVRLRDAIRAADALLFASPEYNFSISGVLKNAIDWASREKEVAFKDKPVALQSASPGQMGGGRMQYHLRMALTAIDAQMFGKPEVFVNFAAKKIDVKTGELTDEAVKDIIKQQLAAFAKFIARVKV